MPWGLIFRQVCHTAATTTTLLLNYFSVDYRIISIRFHTSGCYISINLQIKWHLNFIFSKQLPPEWLQRNMQVAVTWQPKDPEDKIGYFVYSHLALFAVKFL